MLPVSPTLVSYSAVADDRHTFRETPVKMPPTWLGVVSVESSAELEELSSSHY